MKRQWCRVYWELFREERVFFVVPDGFAGVLYSCTVCGEIFFLNQERPDINERSVKDLPSSLRCPKCDSFLARSLEEYPRTFLNQAGELDGFEPSRTIPPDDKSTVKEVWSFDGADWK